MSSKLFKNPTRKLKLIDSLNLLSYFHDYIFKIDMIVLTYV